MEQNEESNALQLISESEEESERNLDTETSEISSDKAAEKENDEKDTSTITTAIKKKVVTNGKKRETISQKENEDDLPTIQLSEKSVKRQNEEKKKQNEQYYAVDITEEDSTEDHDDRIESWIKDHYYAVAFDNTWYPGICTEIDANNSDFAWVKYLHPYGESFRWPDKEDIGLTHINAVMQKVTVASKSNGRLWTIENKKQIDYVYKNQPSVTVAVVEPLQS